MVVERLQVKADNQRRSSVHQNALAAAGTPSTHHVEVRHRRLTPAMKACWKWSCAGAAAPGRVSAPCRVSAAQVHSSDL